MTRKHFEAIAAAMRHNAPNKAWLNKRQQWVKDCEALANEFFDFNAGFDASRFLTACGFDAEELDQSGLL